MAIGDTSEESPIYFNLYQLRNNSWEWIGTHESTTEPTEATIASLETETGARRFPDGGQFSYVPYYEYGAGAEAERVKLRLANPNAGQPAAVQVAVAPVAPTVPGDPMQAAVAQLAGVVDRIAQTVQRQAESTSQAMADMERRMQERMESPNSRFGHFMTQPVPPAPAAGGEGITAGVQLAVEMIKNLGVGQQQQRPQRDDGDMMLKMFGLIQASNDRSTDLLLKVLPTLAGQPAAVAPVEDEWTKVAKRKLMERALAEDAPAKDDAPNTLDVIDKVADRLGGLAMAKLDPKAFAEIEKARAAAHAQAQAQNDEPEPAARSLPTPKKEVTAEDVATYLSNPAGFMAMLQTDKSGEVMESLKQLTSRMDAEQKAAFLAELGLT